MTAWSSTRESHAHLIHAHQQYQQSMSLDAANQRQTKASRYLNLLNFEVFANHRCPALDVRYTDFVA